MSNLCKILENIKPETEGAMYRIAMIRSKIKIVESLWIILDHYKVNLQLHNIISKGWYILARDIIDTLDNITISEKPPSVVFANKLGLFGEWLVKNNSSMISICRVISQLIYSNKLDKLVLMRNIWLIFNTTMNMKNYEIAKHIKEQIPKLGKDQLYVNMSLQMNERLKVI
jgi:hypothetical protein